MKQSATTAIVQALAPAAKSAGRPGLSAGGILPPLSANIFLTDKSVSAYISAAKCKTFSKNVKSAVFLRDIWVLVIFSFPTLKGAFCACAHNVCLCWTAGRN